MTPTCPEFTPGQQLSRADLHQRYGGRLQGRVSPSARSGAVFLFTPETNGIDGWQGSTYLFQGEGHTGDQTLTQGNRAILRSAEDGRRLVVLRESGADVVCAGTFMLDEPPVLELDRPDPARNDDAHRTTYLFRLRPDHPQAAAAVLRARSVLPDPVSRVTLTPLDPAAFPEDRPGRTLTTSLTRHLAAQLRAQGHRVSCPRIEVPGEAAPLYGRLYDETGAVLYDAVANVTRDGVREATGRLLDVARFLNNPALALLCPSEPRPSLLGLLHAGSVTAVWPGTEGHHRSPPPTSGPAPLTPRHGRPVPPDVS